MTNTKKKDEEEKKGKNESGAKRMKMRIGGEERRDDGK